GTSGLVTSKPHPTTGNSSSRVVSATILRVPIFGGNTIHRRRRAPPDRPGIAAIQYSWDWVKVYPSPLSFGTIALGRNQATKARVRLTVVTVRVFHARRESHFSGSSGSQDLIQSPSTSSLVAITRLLPLSWGVR